MQSVINEQTLRISSLKNQLMKLQTSGNKLVPGYDAEFVALLFTNDCVSVRLTA